MFVVFSVIPLLGGGSTRNSLYCTCNLHCEHSVWRVTTALANKTTVQKCSKEFSKYRKKPDSNTGTTETVGASNVIFATKYSRHFVTCSYPWFNHRTDQPKGSCVISGFRREVGKICALLGNYKAYSGYLLTEIFPKLW
jgi:hypothetical protein